MRAGRHHQPGRGRPGRAGGRWRRRSPIADPTAAATCCTRPAARHPSGARLSRRRGAGAPAGRVRSPSAWRSSTCARSTTSRCSTPRASWRSPTTGRSTSSSCARSLSASGTSSGPAATPRCCSPPTRSGARLRRAPGRDVGLLDPRRPAHRASLAGPLRVKPLYWRLRDGALHFASEIKALLAVPGAAPEPNEEVVRRYLLTGGVDESEQNILRRRLQLPPRRRADPLGGAVRACGPSATWTIPPRGTTAARRPLPGSSGRG